MLRLVSLMQTTSDASWWSFSRTVHHAGHEVDAPWRGAFNRYFGGNGRYFVDEAVKLFCDWLMDPRTQKSRGWR